MNNIIPANAPPKASANRRTTMDKSGIHTKGTKIQVVLRCKGNDAYSGQEPGTSSILECIEPIDVNTNSTGAIQTGINRTSTDQNESSQSAASNPVTDVLLSTNNTIYNFDRVFKPDETQETIYKAVAEPILNDVIAGYNCTIFAYGQTGTGKTFTMEGDLSEVNGGCAKNAGIIPRTIYDLFQRLPSQSHVSVSMLEIYNEELRDLLCASPVNQRPLQIFEERGSAKVNCQEHSITTVSRGLSIMKKGVQKRMTAATNCNDQSSRSHCIFTINVRTSKKTDKGEDVFTTGKLNLVDLAGSENNRSSGSENMRAREAANINRSLLTLGRVINCLVDKAPHIPYRESKLTRLLKDSLGGTTKTCIIATVAPAIQNQEEIRSTLDYASIAKGICNQPRLNNVINSERHLDSLVHTIEQLQDELRVNYEKSGVFMTKGEYERKKEEILQLKANLEEVKNENKALSSVLSVKDKMLEEERRKRIEEVEQERERRNREVEKERDQRIKQTEAQKNEYIKLLVKYRDQQMSSAEKQWEKYLAEAKHQPTEVLAELASAVSVAGPSAVSPVVTAVPLTQTPITASSIPNSIPSSLATIPNLTPPSSNTVTTTLLPSSVKADTIVKHPTAARSIAARTARAERSSPIARPLNSSRLPSTPAAKPSPNTVTTAAKPSSAPAAKASSNTVTTAAKPSSAPAAKPSSNTVTAASLPSSVKEDTATTIVKHPTTARSIAARTTRRSSPIARPLNSSRLSSASATKLPSSKVPHLSQLHLLPKKNKMLKH